jgi:hypothetical protein
VLLVFGAPSQLPSLARLEHGPTIPLADLRGRQCGLIAMAVAYFPYCSSETFSSQSTVFPSSASAMAM